MPQSSDAGANVIPPRLLFKYVDNLMCVAALRRRDELARSAFAQHDHQTRLAMAEAFLAERAAAAIFATWDKVKLAGHSASY